MTVPDRPPSLRLHVRPALAAAAALACGIGIEAEVGLGYVTWTLLIGLLALVPVGFARLTAGRIVTPLPTARAAAGLGALLALGAARLASFEAAPADDLSHLALAAARVDSVQESVHVVLRGTVVVPPRRAGANIRLRVFADTVATIHRSGPVTGLVEVTLRHRREAPAERFPQLQLGDEVLLEGSLRAPPSRRNPADFDYARFLARQGVGATMRVDEPRLVTRIRPPQNHLTRLVAAVHARVRLAVEKHVRGVEVRAVLYALLIADRGEIDPETRTAFAETGLMHLLAVSGLHVLLVGLVLYRLLRPSLVRIGLSWRGVEVTRAAITVGILSVYAVVTGGSPSVVRAVVMAGAMVAARTLQRPPDALNGLGLAALGLLLWRPTTLMEVGFQLSFAAVAALVVLSPTLLAFVPTPLLARPFSRAVVGMIVASAAATLGTAPVLLAHFGRVPVAGLLLNVPAIPAANVSLGAGIALSVAAGPAPWAADAFAAVAEMSTRLLLDVNHAGADLLHWSAVRGFIRSPLFLACAVLALLSLACWRAPRSRWRLVCLAVVAGGLGTWQGVAAGTASPHLDAVFLDVGQGDAALLSFPGGHHVLVDAGPRDPAWDAGLRTVVPHLQRHGISDLAALIVTHPHVDHFGGVASVMRQVGVGRVIMNAQPVEHPMLLEALQVADSLGVPVQSLGAGDTVSVGPGGRLRVLGPSPATAYTADANDGSLVLRVQYGLTSMLLLGDAEIAGEAGVTTRYGRRIASDVIKVAHHGSRTSSTDEMVAAAGRRRGWAVVSVARRNRYGLPDEEPIARWLAAGLRVVTTSSEGAVWLRSDGRAFRRVPWR